MKTSKKAVALEANPPMPESLRKAFELAATEAWICANTVAEASWRENLAFLEKQVMEAEQVRATLAAEIVDLRKKLASSEAKADTAASLAKEELSKASLQISTLTDAARRAEANAANISSQLEDLMTNLRPTAASSEQSPPTEINFGPETRDPPHDHMQRSVTEDTGSGGPTAATPRADAERRAALQQEESELVAAAAVLIKAICKFRERLP